MYKSNKQVQITLEKGSYMPAGLLVHYTINYPDTYQLYDIAYKSTRVSLPEIEKLACRKLQRYLVGFD